MLKINSRKPKENSIFFSVNLTKFVNFGTAITKVNKIYQRPSTKVAVATSINLLCKLDAAFKNWLNIARKKAAILGLRKTITKPLRKDSKNGADTISEVPTSIEGSWKLFLIIENESQSKNNKPVSSRAMENQGATERRTINPDTTNTA